MPTSQVSYDWSSRKFLIFAFTTVSSSWLLWIRALPAEDYLQLVLWVTMMYFGANVWQKGMKVNTHRPVKVRLLSRKFVILLIMLMFFTFATMSGVLPSTQYTTLMIWMTGIYFGIDISEIYAFRGIRGVGHFFRDEVDPNQNNAPPYGPPGPYPYFGKSATEVTDESNSHSNPPEGMSDDNRQSSKSPVR